MNGDLTWYFNVKINTYDATLTKNCIFNILNILFTTHPIEYILQLNGIIVLYQRNKIWDFLLYSCLYIENELDLPYLADVSTKTRNLRLRKMHIGIKKRFIIRVLDPSSDR